MNKYQDVLECIGNIELDRLSDGYDSPKYLKDFFYGEYKLLHELVDKATPKKPIVGEDEENAKEMFEELGFEYKKYRNGFAYEYDGGKSIKHVHFDLSMHKYCTNIYHVDIRLHNAITMQMKELGWVDDD